jgi:ABC-2 type transport system ATP-binding protein
LANIIELDHLTKGFKGGRGKFETLAVDDLSFSVQQGEIFGFLGPNGAGKTTTLYTLLGFLYPSSGGGSIFDRPFGDPEALRRIGYLPEYVNLHEYYTPDGMLNYYARLSGLDPHEARLRASYVLERLGIADVCRKRISKFSKGMVQRLGLAQAVLGNPDLLFLDEPTSSLDPVGRKEVKDLLLELKAQGKTIVISSHILSDIESVCDRVVIIRKGRLMATGKLDELLSTGGGVRMTTDKLSAEAVSEIQQLGGVVTGSATAFEIDLPDREKEYDVIGVLRKHGNPLVSVVEKKSSLEDFFFDVVKGDEAK